MTLQGFGNGLKKVATRLPHLTLRHLLTREIHTQNPKTISFKLDYPLIMKMQVTRTLKVLVKDLSIQELQSRVFKDLWEMPLFDHQTKHGNPAQLEFHKNEGGLFNNLDIVHLRKDPPNDPVYLQVDVNKEKK